MTLRSEVRPALVAMAATLLSFGSAVLLRSAAGLDLTVVVLAVVLGISLSRSQRGRDLRHRLTGLVLVPVVGVAAAEVGRLLVRHQNVGDTLFVLALSAAVWLRQFPRTTLLARFISLPFIAPLITPVPPTAASMSVGWVALIALIATFWVGALQLGADRIGFTDTPPEPPVRAPPRRPPAPGRRLSPTTKLALQMAVALASAFAVGRWLFPDHWSWVVITAFITSAGNRGRGEVIHKGAQRLAGAAAGTVAATLVAGLFPPHSTASIVLIFVLVAAATTLRGVSYAYWAAGITGVIALFYGYLGQTGTDLLDERLGGIVLGAALAIAAAWFVFPIPAGDVLRRRAADALAALTDVLVALRRRAAGRDGEGPSLPEALDALDAAVAALHQIAPAFRAHRRSVGRRRPVHAAEAIDALGEAARLAHELAAQAAPNRAALTTLTDRVVAIRRAIGRLQPYPAPAALELPVAAPERRLADALTTASAALATVTREPA